MAAQLVDTGKLSWLALVQAAANGDPYTFGLFTNNAVIAHDLLFGGLTEASWSGYARGTTSGWGTPSLTGDFHAKTTADAVPFVNSSGSDHTYRGWFVVDGAGDLVTAFNYGADQTIPAGATIDLIPSLTLTTE